MTSKEENLLDGSNEIPSQDSVWCQLLRASKEQLFQEISQAQLQQISPTALAYLGDAVCELYVRMFYLLPSRRPEAYHRLVVAQVRAETQAKMLESLYPHLNNTELEIVRRGRNAATGRPRRVDMATYQQATSLETLIGYLYLTDFDRLSELLQKLDLEKP
ncbi:MAG: ribonuclease III [Brasilonema octagenarum HA4186-MV1]|uniref:Mini-ribonuclease 3 n=2 Tax=Brasilonema TaxID=383614 RepID=A0A856MLA7_9CYAN|nr:ribonuclease III domain-containing protein [Brasilonema sennae]MBW4625239.1 ribonuclease III [Brasilonema octagenarum HA4186-MV1]NMF65040.1 ribonuclease III [Brasilonema octagenarum UFV-OR1]QDL10910.1 ribonuclease III [Brasilonema sennae CENA114]QDL18817.1 ribonuclease III [Brasilonema octagenarum UFV-E1]